MRGYAGAVVAAGRGRHLQVLYAHVVVPVAPPHADDFVELVAKLHAATRDVRGVGDDKLVVVDDLSCWPQVSEHLKHEFEEHGIAHATLEPETEDCHCHNREC